MPSRKLFDKPALSIESQITLLTQRGLHFPQPTLAHHFLETIGYYRLMAYFKPFLVDRQDADKGFLPKTTFSHILQLYIFDRELRLLAVDALELLKSHSALRSLIP